ncbi:hypothetical protein BAU06_04295 [Bordetella bronchialis]|uniref:Uncharacterized protein n=1 Tax=Bordetella bronchialis TaxID=463025 RepID=A0ABM6CNU3_9BORD|nr:hypothetical protein BAU06_04295 [Bordetella bronchialis]
MAPIMAIHMPRNAAAASSHVRPGIGGQAHIIALSPHIGMLRSLMSLAAGLLAAARLVLD